MYLITVFLSFKGKIHSLKYRKSYLVSNLFEESLLRVIVLFTVYIIVEGMYVEYKNKFSTYLFYIKVFLI